jgi:transposase
MDSQLDLAPTSPPRRPTYDELLAIIAELRATIAAQNERIRRLEEENALLKKKLYGKRSEKGDKQGRTSGGGGKRGGSTTPRVRSLQEQYPDAEVENRTIRPKTTPLCQCCSNTMVDSGLEEVTEQLHTVPAKHKITRIIRPKYKCNKCYTGLLNVPAEPRIAPGSSMGDSFIIEAALAKFYYLIPAERYADMISLSGLKGFPAQMVLSAHHSLADFLKPVYLKLRSMIQASPLLHADETPHRMFEMVKTSWYLWGFSTPEACYFEIKPTRSGDIAIDFLVLSNCLYLMSDVYIGYDRAIREVNAVRLASGLPGIIALYCNAHARRRFVEALVSYPEEAQYFIDQYKKIYKLDEELKLLTDPKSRTEKRTEMSPYFEDMLAMGADLRDAYSTKSSLIDAINYFTNNYIGLTSFLSNPDLPIDNNVAERMLRSPVIGRKTWFGTHSERGAETTEILFSIMQTCKALKVNPREYLHAVARAMLSGLAPFTPSEYLASIPDKKAA